MARSRLSTIPLAAALALMPVLVFGADGPLQGGDEQVTTEITPETPYTAADVSEIASHFGISEEEADLRLRLERASVGFEPQLIEAFPATFGGAWLETDGAPGLTVALTSGAADALPVIQSMFAIPDAVRTVTVEHSLGDLLALQQQMIDDRTALQSSDAPLVHVLSVTGGNYDLDIDVQRSVVVVRLPEFSEELSDAFAQLYGTSMLVVEGNGSAPEVCTRADCRYTLRGGLRLTGGGDVCSSAFSAVAGSNYYLLSAAHCAGGSGSPRLQGGEQYGTVTLEQRQGRVDAERTFRPWPSSWYVSASIYVESNDIRPVRYHITWDSTMEGTLVGKSGQTTGTTRGDITSKFGAPTGVSGSNRFLVADYCANPGDSGGSVFNTNTAYGIHHGGPTVGNPPVARVCGDPLDFGYFGNIVYAKDALGVSILAAP